MFRPAGMAGLQPAVSLFPFGRARFALGRLFAPQRFRHEFISEHELRLTHVLDRQQRGRIFAFRIVAHEPRGFAVCARERCP